MLFILGQRPESREPFAATWLWPSLNIDGDEPGKVVSAEGGTPHPRAICKNVILRALHAHIAYVCILVGLKWRVFNALPLQRKVVILRWTSIFTHIRERC